MTWRVRLRGWYRRFRAYWTARGVIPRYQYLLVYAVIVAAGAVGIQKVGDAAEEGRGAARQAQAAAHRAEDAITQLQRNRVELCLQANDRHDKTVRVLDRAIRELHGAQRIQAEENRAQTLAFIEALAPQRDCRQELAIPHK